VSIQLNHTIVAARDNEVSANFLTEILGLPAPKKLGHFMAVEVDNGVTLDFMDSGGDIASQHYAFLISEAEFDECFGRIKDRDLTYWADPGRTRKFEVRTHDGGRGVYFLDPDGHLMEILTRA